MFKETENGGFLAEPQGPFAPEILPETEKHVVFSREFSDGVKVITVSAAPVIPDRYLPFHYGNDAEPDMPADAYGVSVNTEWRDVGDEHGDTSEYEWYTLNYMVLTLDEAIKYAENYIRRIDPKRDF